MRPNNNTQQNPQSNFVGSSFSKPLKVFLWLLLAVLCIPLFQWAYKLIKKAQMSAETQQLEADKTKQYVENQNPQVLQKKLDKITIRKDIQSDAKLIAHHLGTLYNDTPDALKSWYNPFTWDWIKPRGWTENDEAAAVVLQRQRANYTKLALCYYQITNSHNLSYDLNKLLDDDVKARVRRFLKF